jgi:hypothetical protein
MNNIINLQSCVVCTKIGIHWLCHKCESRIHHPSVYVKVERYRDMLNKKLSEVSNG